MHWRRINGETGQIKTQISVTEGCRSCRCSKIVLALLSWTPYGETMSASTLQTMVCPTCEWICYWPFAEGETFFDYTYGVWSAWTGVVCFKYLFWEAVEQKRNESSENINPKDHGCRTCFWETEAILPSKRDAYILRSTLSELFGDTSGAWVSRSSAMTRLSKHCQVLGQGCKMHIDADMLQLSTVELNPPGNCCLWI